MGCKELRSKRYISDGFCTSIKPITEVVCTGHCLPVQELPWYAEFIKVWATTKVLEWRCVEDLVKRKRVNLMCENGESRTYRIKVVKSCKCKRYMRQQNQSLTGSERKKRRGHHRRRDRKKDRDPEGNRDREGLWKRHFRLGSLSSILCCTCQGCPARGLIYTTGATLTSMSYWCRFRFYYFGRAPGFDEIRLEFRTLRFSTPEFRCRDVWMPYVTRHRDLAVLNILTKEVL